MTDIESKRRVFREMHEPGAAFLMPNAWDAGSARLLSSLGFPAIGTTSAGYAFSQGRRDSFGSLSRAEVLANAGEIAKATALPVSADLEDGFGAAPEICAETVRLAAGAGLAGGSIEDATGDPDDPIYAFDLAVARVEASAEAARETGFVLTARAENLIWGRPDLDDTIRRLRAFAAAGADVVYAPGLPDLAAVARVCREVRAPVNVVMGLSGEAPPVPDLVGAGVARITTGGALARAALGAVKRAAFEMLKEGTFRFAAEAIPDVELAALMSQDRLPRRV